MGAVVARPFGCLYRPASRDKTGRVVPSSVWWIKWSENGKTRYTCTNTTNRREAERVRKRLRDESIIAAIKTERRRGTSLGEVLRLLIADYEVTGKSSVRRAELSVRTLLSILPETMPAVEVTEARIVEYARTRRELGAANGTINRELAALRRAFKLAHRSFDAEGAPLVPRVPSISMLAEAPPRQGFYDEAEVRQIASHLPEWAAAPILFLWITGWRRSAALRLEWRHVDRKARQIRVAAGAPNKPRAAVWPYGSHPELEGIIDQQWAAHEELQRQGRLVPWVFHRGGAPLIVGGDNLSQAFREAWDAARNAAGLPHRILHDFRRTAARNLTRAGLQRGLAMRLTGHLTESIFERYNIVTEDDLADGVKMLAEYHARQDDEREAQLRLPLK